MTHLCPFGHRVHVPRSKEGDGHCGECENVYPAAWLIPTTGKVGKRNYELYARAYRAGYRAALEKHLQEHDVASAMIRAVATA